MGIIDLLGGIRVNLFLGVVELLSDAYRPASFVFTLVLAWNSDSFGSRGFLSEVAPWDESVFGSTPVLIGLLVVGSHSLEIHLRFYLLLTLGYFFRF